MSEKGSKELLHIEKVVQKEKNLTGSGEGQKQQKDGGKKKPEEEKPITKKCRLAHAGMLRHQKQKFNHHKKCVL